MASGERLLILGATGFLGHHLVRLALEEESLGVVACARQPARIQVDRADAGRLNQISADLRDHGAMEALFERVRPTSCILAAALSRMGACEADPEDARLTNSLGPEQIARLTRAGGVRFVHVSTDLVFGGPPPRAEGYREEDKTQAKSVYGSTKAEGERRVLTENPGALVCRLPLLFGDSAGRGLGASDQMDDLLSRGQRPSLFTDERRSPLDVGDAARALLELAGVGKQAAALHKGLLHVAGPQALDRFSLGVLILEARGLPRQEIESALESSTRVVAGLAAQRPADVSLDSGRARALLRTRLRSVPEAL